MKKKQTARVDLQTKYFFLGVLVATICATIFVVAYMTYNPEDGWIEVKSYRHYGAGETACQAVSPECGVCGYGDDSGSYKIVGEKCYVKKNQ